MRVAGQARRRRVRQPRRVGDGRLARRRVVRGRKVGTRGRRRRPGRGGSFAARAGRVLVRREGVRRRGRLARSPRRRPRGSGVHRAASEDPGEGGRRGGRAAESSRGGDRRRRGRGDGAGVVGERVRLVRGRRRADAIQAAGGFASTGSELAAGGDGGRGRDRGERGRAARRHAPAPAGAQAHGALVHRRHRRVQGLPLETLRLTRRVRRSLRRRLHTPQRGRQVRGSVPRGARHRRGAAG
mmetsp:Transcript_10723/g.46440  ORF Transcript_10723/g.46440 Transcript_10723/m.46440 type:complete len:241 (-) Transcript_10723:2693-3415(-)